MLPISHHAQARLQQRGIPPIIVERLLDFGRETYVAFVARFLSVSNSSDTSR